MQRQPARCGTATESNVDRRDFLQTAVQTAVAARPLPVLSTLSEPARAAPPRGRPGERRVGAECRSRWAPDH